MITKMQISAVLFLLGLSACAGGGDDASLTLPNAPKTLSVGQTVSTAPATERTRDVQGRLMTNAQFTNYGIVSADTTIVKASGVSITGIKAGTTLITAEAEDGSGFISAKYSVTVQP